MIDVVFLLLVFFMLAARFGQEGALPLTIATGGDTAWSGPPRLLQVGPHDILLNGRVEAPEALVLSLSELVQPGADLVLLRPVQGADMQRLLDVMTLLQAGGLTNLTLVAP